MSLTMSSITSEEAKELTVPLKKPDHLLAVPDHRVNYKRRTPPVVPRKNNCCKRALIFLSFIFCLSTLALVGILLWREFSHKECQEGLLPVQEKFPGYFRTKDQQKEFKKMVKKFSKPVPVDTSLVMGYECETKCSAYNYVNVTTTTADVRLENSDLCCESSVKYVALRNLTNLQGVTRVLSRGNDTLQYFPIHTCRQNSGCKGCQCVQTPRIFTAVYENRVTTLEGGAEVEHALDWFSLPDNCHCRAHT